MISAYLPYAIKRYFTTPFCHAGFPEAKILKVRGGRKRQNIFSISGGSVHVQSSPITSYLSNLLGRAFLEFLFCFFAQNRNGAVH